MDFRMEIADSGSTFISGATTKAFESDRHLSIDTFGGEGAESWSLSIMLLIFVEGSSGETSEFPWLTEVCGHLIKGVLQIYSVMCY